MSSVVEQIKDKISIVDVVSSHLKLEKAGANFKGNCPFHNEKTPSFFVSPDRGTYYCFGCGAKGDIFSFIEQSDGVDFPQALATLAEKAGVSLSDYDRVKDKDKQTLHTVLEAALIFFERGLDKDSTAKEYLLGRGLKEKTIRDWRIGYVGGEWRSLYDHLTSAGYSTKDMLATGLIKASNSNYYDVFRSRIIFPIWNASGKIVGFSGRIFPNDDAAPKYLNSPDTVLFKKSDVLYGFDRAKTDIRKKGYSIVVEGQMDLVMSHQAGFTNTVATSGTALTELHLKRLARVSPRVMFAYDSDSAGISAVRRASELGLSLGLEVKIAPLPAGEDPASLLLKSPPAYAQAIKSSEHVIDFSVSAIARATSNEREQIRKIKDEVFPLLLFLKSSVDRSHFLKKISEKLNLREESLWEDLKAVSKNATQTASQSGVTNNSGGVSGGASQTTGQQSRRNSIERTLIGVVYWQRGLDSPIKPPEEIFSELEKIIGSERLGALEAEVEPEKDKLIFEVEKYLEGSTRFEAIIKELFTDLQAEELKRQFAKTMADLRQAELKKDSAEVERLLKQCNDISVSLTKLEKTTE